MYIKFNEFKFPHLLSLCPDHHNYSLLLHVCHQLWGWAVAQFVNQEGALKEQQSLLGPHPRSIPDSRTQGKSKQRNDLLRCSPEQNKYMKLYE